MLVASLVAFLASNHFATLKLAFNFWDPFSITEYRLSRLSDEEYKIAVEQALDDQDIPEAQTLVEIAHENGRALPQELVERTKENPFEFGLRNIQDFANGAMTGEITSVASIGGVLAADYVGVGDVRDVVVQGASLAKGEDYDTLTLGLALAGLATIAPGSGAADAGFSLIKTANKAGKLSRNLVSRLKMMSTRLVDVAELKRGLLRVSLPKFKRPSISTLRAIFGEINWRDVANGDFQQVREPLSEMMPVDTKAAKQALSGAIRKEVLDEVGVLASSTSWIVSAGGVKAGFRAMEYADDAKELSRFRSLAARMGGKTAAAIKLLGKGAIKLGELVYLVISVLIIVIGWLVGALWFLYSLTRTIYRAAERETGAS
ncbi:hypothetical protein ASD64_19905 [Mesorhizobium sp. Root157]|uniref:hypothetical protein n=1 Tax=Mesorhizobium sp. Root157 TaxID=1736477 RepID=UPI0006FB1310|nr:hypothetical protein [Mesorhizobium sp. Root157]KQZ87852.1 hypothetical protein ASD64_19905 [Mesorhizobium sp. Root157]